MRQGRLEAALRFLKCCRLKCALACEREKVDQSLLIGERSRFEQMVRDISGARADAPSLEPLDRARNIGMQSLLARRRDPGEQRLTDKFLAQRFRPLRPLAPRVSHTP